MYFIEGTSVVFFLLMATVGLWECSMVAGEEGNEAAYYRVLRFSPFAA